MSLAVVSDSTGSSSIDAVFTEFLTRAVILSSILFLFSDQFFGAFFDTFHFNQQRIALNVVIVDLKNGSYLFLLNSSTCVIFARTVEVAFCALYLVVFVFIQLSLVTASLSDINNQATVSSIVSSSIASDGFILVEKFSSLFSISTN